LSTAIGVALFYDGTPFCREGGIACPFRGEPFEFGAVSDLPSHTLWVTNCSVEDLVKANLHRNPRIAHNGYYKTRLDQIVNELGLATFNPFERAALLAELLGISAEMAKLQLGFAQHPVRGLAQAVGQLYGLTDCADGSAVQQVATLASQRYTQCERPRRLERPEVFSFWMPRYEWAQKLLNTPLPSNETLQVIPPHSLPSNGQDAAQLVEWAKENRIPLFAKIRIHALEENVGRLLNYGAGANAVTSQTADGGAVTVRNSREWCALPELEVLAESGDIELERVAMSTGWVSPGLHPYANKLAPVSYAYGIVAENLWAGVMRRPDQTGRVSRNLSTAWLQAEDRMHCLRVAERIGDLGMDVISYGNGRVTVACPVAVRNLIPKVAREQGVLYPASLKDLPHYEPRSDIPMQVLQHLINTGSHAQMNEVNKTLLQMMREAHEAK
jgi:hypothetical protein